MCVHVCVFVRVCYVDTPLGAFLVHNSVATFLTTDRISRLDFVLTVTF